MQTAKLTTSVSRTRLVIIRYPVITIQKTQSDVVQVAWKQFSQRQRLPVFALTCTTSDCVEKWRMMGIKKPLATLRFIASRLTFRNSKSNRFGRKCQKRSPARKRVAVCRGGVGAGTLPRIGRLGRCSLAHHCRLAGLLFSRAVDSLAFCDPSRNLASLGKIPFPAWAGNDDDDLGGFLAQSAR